MKIDAKGVSPDVVAAVAAAVTAVMGTGVLALRIKPSTIWSLTGRQKLMNAH